MVPPGQPPRAPSHCGEWLSPQQGRGAGPCGDHRWGLEAGGTGLISLISLPPSSSSVHLSVFQRIDSFKVHPFPSCSALEAGQYCLVNPPQAAPCGEHPAPRAAIPVLWAPMVCTQDPEALWAPHRALRVPESWWAVDHTPSLGSRRTHHQGHSRMGLWFQTPRMGNYTHEFKEGKGSGS